MNRRLKIGVDARPLSLPMTGITRYTWELLNRLVQLGDHEWYLYLNRPPQQPLPTGPNVHVRQGRFQGKAAGQIFVQTVFPLWARRDGLDAYWSPRHHLPLTLPRNIRTLLTIHDLVWEFYPETMATQGKWVELMLMPGSLRKADRIITVSRATRDDLIGEFPLFRDKIDTVWPGLTHHPAGEGPPPCAQPYFLFVGTIEPRKNLLRLLDAFARVVSQRPECRLLIVGDQGWGGNDLQRRIRELKLEDRVFLHGKADDRMLATCYAHAQALVLPSLYEGFGLPLLEAMGHGTPVITSAIGAMKEVAGQGGILVDPDQDQDIARAMMEMLDPQVRSQYAHNGKRRAAAFDWDKSASAVMREIEGLCADR